MRRVHTKGPFRSWTPVAHPGAYQTFNVTPFWRQATCAEYQCDAYLHGWASVFDEGTQLGRDQAAYVRTQAGRHFKETRTEAGLTRFDFPAGQACFQEVTHRVQANRPELYVVRGGDWRAQVGTPHVYDRPDQWADDFATHTDRLFTARSRAGTANY